jgi:hypothetical protein
MTTADDRNDILEAFAAEEVHNKATLDRYVERFPAFALDLIKLSFLIDNLVEIDRPLSEHDENRIESAWSQVKQSIATTNADALSRLNKQAAKVARETGLPRQVISALRERMIDPGTITWRFLRQVGQSAEILPEVLKAAVSAPAIEAARSFSSLQPPQKAEQIPLRKVLEDARVPAALMEDLLRDE